MWSDYSMVKVKNNVNISKYKKLFLKQKEQTIFQKKSKALSQKEMFTKCTGWNLRDEKVIYAKFSKVIWYKCRNNSGCSCH